LDSQLNATLAKYMLPDEEISDDLFDLREFTRTPRPWDNLLQDSEDYAEALEQAGFRQIEVWEDRPVTCRLPFRDFMAYKLAWANRRAELEAMDASLRGDCLDALRDLFQDAADEQGEIHYAPLLFRVRARA
jgi:hypothetical protein